MPNATNWETLDTPIYPVEATPQAFWPTQPGNPPPPVNGFVRACPLHTVGLDLVRWVFHDPVAVTYSDVTDTQMALWESLGWIRTASGVVDVSPPA